MKKYHIKQITILILFLSILILTNCLDSYKEEKKKRNSDNRVALLQMIGLSWGTKEEGKVVDNRDGTLTYTYTLIQTNSWLGSRVLSEKTILIRRCLIGQVYRPDPNDCQGTGTKETVWGASQLQWCPTNDRSCEKDGKADPAISPAAKACAEDTFAGKKWRLVSITDGLGAFDNITNGSILNDYRRASGYIIIWSIESSSDELVYDPLSSGGSVAEKNNNKVNILCVGEIV